MRSRAELAAMTKKPASMPTGADWIAAYRLWADNL